MNTAGTVTRFLALGLGLILSMSAASSAAVDVPAPGKSPTLDRIRERHELRVGIALALPWIGQDPKTSKYFGPTIEMSERLAKILGVELKLFPTTWDALIAQLQSNKVDLLPGPLFATEERRQAVDFVTWTEAGTCYAVLKSNDKVNTVEDLNQPTVSIGVYTGTGTENLVRSKYTKAKIDSIPMPVANANRLSEVAAKRLDATWLDSPTALLIAKQYPEMKIIPGGPDNCIAKPDLPFPMGIAFPYGDPELKVFLEAAIADMRNDLDASVQKHSQLKYMLQPQ